MSADALGTAIAATGTDLGGVVTLVEPGGVVADVAALSGARVEHVVIECIDATMSDDDWVGRFGGRADELFGTDDAVRLAAVGRKLAGTTIVQCGQGISRSTAAAVLLGAAAGLGPGDAVRASVAAQRRSFAWREPEAWLPNSRIVHIGSQVLYGDDRLDEAVARFQT